MHTVNQVCLREAEPQAEVHVFLQGGPVQLQSLHLPPPPPPPPRPPPPAPDRLVIIPLINFILQRPFICYSVLPCSDTVLPCNAMY